MKIDWLYKEEISKLLEFNEDTGKYEKYFDKYKVEINSWNNKLFIKEHTDYGYVDVPIELIKLIVDIDRIRNIRFEEEK